MHMTYLFHCLHNRRKMSKIRFFAFKTVKAGQRVQLHMRMSKIRFFAFKTVKAGQRVQLHMRMFAMDIP
jgi:cold shock CspA family protein